MVEGHQGVSGVDDREADFGVILDRGGNLE